jgi:hypothetical protein
MLSEQ